jgi:hypothetical protein
MKLSKLTDWLELTEAGIKMFEERTRSERHNCTGVMRMLACCEENLQEEKRYLSRLISVLYFILIFRDSGIATYVAVY